MQPSAPIGRDIVRVLRGLGSRVQHTPPHSIVRLGGKEEVEERQKILDLIREMGGVLSKLCGAMYSVSSSAHSQNSETIVADLPESLRNLRGNFSAFMRFSERDTEKREWVQGLLFKINECGLRESISTFENEADRLIASEGALTPEAAQVFSYLQKFLKQLEQLESLITGDENQTPPLGVPTAR